MSNTVVDNTLKCSTCSVMQCCTVCNVHIQHTTKKVHVLSLCYDRSMERTVVYFYRCFKTAFKRLIDVCIDGVGVVNELNSQDFTVRFSQNISDLIKVDILEG